MQATGTVTAVRRTHSKAGSPYAAVTLDDGATLKFIALGYVPTKGERITISGIPMVGYTRVNLGGVRITKENES